MHTTDPGRIEQLTSEGLWGSDTLHSLLAAQVASCVDHSASAPLSRANSNAALA